MRTKIGIMVATAALLCASIPAQAADIATPALTKGVGEWFNCRVANVHTKDLEITLDIRGSTGGVLETQTFSPVPAGNTQSVLYTGGSSIAYCVASGKPNKKKTPITLCRTDSAGVCLVAVKGVGQ
jgi:hypothetical protein